MRRTALSRRLAMLIAVLSAICCAAGCRARRQPPHRTAPHARSAQVPTLERMRADYRALTRHTDARPANPLLVPEYENFRLYLRKAELFLRVPELPDYALPMLYREIMHAKDSARFVLGNTLPPIAAGLREEGYYAANDDSYEPFLRCLPPGVREGKPLPLVVFLHGYFPGQDLLNWTGMEHGLVQLCTREGIAVVKPFGRSNTDFQAIGEQDVLNVIAAMQSRYPIDPERIVLAGYSMGGMGAWSIAAHHPHLFAGVLVIAGRGDYYNWHGIEPRDLPLHKRRFADTEFAAPLVSNLRHLPFLSFHGEFDNLVPTSEARHIAGLAREAGVNLQYTEIPDRSHWIAGDVLARPDVTHWIKTRRRTVPIEFDYTTHDPRFNRAHWLQLDGFRIAELPAHVSVRSVDARLVVRARGVRRVTVDRSLMPAQARRRPVTVEGAVTLEVREVGAAPPPPPPERGPLRNVFLSPFIFVAGGQPAGGEAMDALRAATVAWYAYSKALPRMTYEPALSDNDLQAYNVCFFGAPENSPRIREVIGASPLRITENSYVIGERSFPRRGNGLYMVYRSPWRDGGLAVVQCGLPWGAGTAENHYYDFLPDFIVYSAGQDADGSNRALCAGFFDENWQLDERLTWTPGQTNP